MSTNRLIQFSVDKIEQVGPELYTVGGRCYEGGVTVGDRFDSIVDIQVVRTVSEYRALAPRHVDAVALSVEKIWFYGQYVRAIDSGHSALLTVKGTGGSKLKMGHVLQGQKG